jgi:hypothetical protein
LDNKVSCNAIGLLGGNVYIQKSWIIQEVAVAGMVSLPAYKHRDSSQKLIKLHLRSLFSPGGPDEV